MRCRAFNFATCSLAPPSAPPGDECSIHPTSLSLRPCWNPAAPSRNARRGRSSGLNREIGLSSTSPTTTSASAAQRSTRRFWRAERSTKQNPCRKSLQRAVDGLRRAGQQQYLPLGFLTRAWLRCVIGARTGPESAQSDLNEAFEIAERGPMPRHMADIHLYRARLFGLSKDRTASYP